MTIEHFLPKTIEYAIKTLTCLAFKMDRPTPASDVARCVRIPPSQAAKILHFLNWAGLTRSSRGAHGGYVLRRPPEEIRIEEVVKLFQPPPEVDSAAPPDPLHQVMRETSAGCQQAWEQLTIAELAYRTADQWECPTCAEVMEPVSVAATSKDHEGH